MAIPKKKLREDYRDGELYHGEDVNAITKRVNELDDASVDITLELEGKQDKLTAGDNITIENNVISARPQDMSQYALSADVATELAKKADASALTEYQEATNAAISANTRDIEILDNGKQDKLTAGKNIQIDVYNTISAKGYEYKEEKDQFEIGRHTLTSNPNEVAMGRYNYTRTEGGSGNTLVSIGNGTEDPASGRSNAFEVLDNGKVYIDGVGGYDGRYIENHKSVSEVISDLENGKQDVLTAGENVTIENNVISAHQPDLTPYATTEAMNEALSGKQDTLIAGSGITIENNVISAQQPSLEGYAKQCDVILVGSDMDGANIDWSPATGMTKPGVYRALLYVANQLITDEMIVQYFGSVEAFLAYCSQNGITVIRDEAQSGYLIVEAEVAMRMTVTNYVVGSLVQSFTYDYSFAKHMYERVFDQSSNSWSTQYYRFLSGNDSDDLNSAFKSDVTFSRRKIEELLAGKQNNLTAGTNITIQNGVISAQQPDLSPYALSADVTTELAKKTDVSAFTAYTASTTQLVNGMAHEIDENASAITALQESKQDKLTAGTNITIQNNVISAQQPDLSPYALSADVQSAITHVEESKQDKLTAGTNITIHDNVISATQPDVSGKMNKVDYEVAYTLPSGAIDLSPLDNVLTPGIYNLKVNSFVPDTSYNGVLMVGKHGNSYSQEVIISGSQTQILKRASSNNGSTWTTMYAGCLAHINDSSDGSGYGGINTTYTADKILTLLDEKQDSLSAGTGIQIVDNVISVNGGGGAVIDDTTTASTTVWSSQKTNQGLEALQIELINLT